MAASMHAAQRDFVSVGFNGLLCIGHNRELPL
jgi:hypothetical protein